MRTSIALALFILLLLNTSRVASGASTLPPFPYASVCAPHLETFKFSQALNGVSKKMDNVQYPRQNSVLYRGIGNNWEINSDNFIRSLVDNTIYYESWAYRVYKNEFLGLNDAYTSSTVNDYFALHGILERFKGLKACLDRLEQFKEQEASHLAAALIDMSFEQHKQNNLLHARYLNYQSQTNVDYVYAYPQNFTATDKFIGRGEIIFTALTYQMASFYSSDYLTGFSDSKKRTLDLNFYNYLIDNTWTHSEYDAGEFIQSGYFPSEDIRYLKRRGDRYSFVKVIFEGVPMILLLGAHPSSELILNPTYLDLPLKHPDTLFGVIRLCEEGAFCPIPRKLIKKFGSFKNYTPEPYFLDAVQRESYNGKKFQFVGKRTKAKDVLAR